MEEKSILEKIQSQYILSNVLSFIKDDIYLYRLLTYSKSLQKKFNFEQDSINYHLLKA